MGTRSPTYRRTISTRGQYRRAHWHRFARGHCGHADRGVWNLKAMSRIKIQSKFPGTRLLEDRQRDMFLQPLL